MAFVTKRDRQRRRNSVKMLRLRELRNLRCRSDIRKRPKLDRVTGRFVFTQWTLTPGELEEQVRFYGARRNFFEAAREAAKAATRRAARA